MKEEDLKVGTILHKDDRYFRIFKKVNNLNSWPYLCEIMTLEYGIYDCISSNLNIFCKGNFEIVDKVPAKIEEVEEEVSVYVNKSSYDKIFIIPENEYVKIDSTLRVGESAVFMSDALYIELCKIKRKVKREVNFSWEKNLWE